MKKKAHGIFLRRFIDYEIMEGNIINCTEF